MKRRIAVELRGLIFRDVGGTMEGRSKFCNPRYRGAKFAFCVYLCVYIYRGNLRYIRNAKSAW